ncbi:hypothetical protein B5M44_25680 [Shinella sumterensis]|nr:hypothetical protein B5M44_25680 [Shinella sumterensis]
MSRTRFGDFAALCETGTVLTVGFLTIEERRKRNVVGDVADRFLNRSWKETLAVTFIKRSYTGFRAFPQGEALENRCEVLVDFERDLSQ